MDQADEIRAGAVDVENLAAYLRGYGVDFWAEALEHYAVRLRTGDYYSGVGLIGLFGGMGSLNDLIISALNGHDVTPEEEDQANKKLEELRKKVGEFAGRFR